MQTHAEAPFVNEVPESESLRKSKALELLFSVWDEFRPIRSPSEEFPVEQLADFHHKGANASAVTSQDGTTWSGANTIVGNVWNAAGSTTVKGVAYKVRGAATPSADGKSWTFKQELSVDGKTWMPWTDIKITKS